MFQSGMMSGRQKLLSTLPKVYEDISPLTIKELKNADSNHEKSAKKTEELFTPKGKRKRSDDQENKFPNKFAKYGVKKHSPLLQKAITPVILTPEQNKVLKAVQEGSNIFFTGSAGTGKSFLLKRIIGELYVETFMVSLLLSFVKLIIFQLFMIITMIILSFNLIHYFLSQQLSFSMNCSLTFCI